jgi:AAA domain
MAATLAGLTSTATRAACGTSTRRSSSRFPASSEVRILTPVMLPPGRERFVTRPSRAGSSPTRKTTGSVVVAALAANARFVGFSAGDRFVLGETKPVQGDVLYIAAEDNQRRLKKRIDKILQTAAAPEGLEIHTEWKRVDQGGLEDIEAWCKSKPRRRLIWIDTLAKIRPIIGRSEQAYAADYRAIEGLQKLAGEYQVGIVLNHHLRKAGSEDDAFDDVSGTLGLTGAADTIIVMKRHAGR